MITAQEIYLRTIFLDHLHYDPEESGLLRSPVLIIILLDLPSVDGIAI
jgi:hypothetical protein